LTVSKDVNYDKVTKTHNMKLCALDEGAFNLKILCQRNRVNHSGTLVPSSVNGDIAIQWEWSNFDPSHSQNPNPLTD